MSADPAEEILRKNLVRAERGVVSAYLFGSEAESRAHAESDLDVGVLLRIDRFPSRRDRFEQRLLLSAELGSGLGGRAIDLVVLNDAPPSLARHIVTRGRRMFCVDSAVDHAFVREAQLRAADLAPFIRRMRRIKLDVLGQS